MNQSTTTSSLRRWSRLTPIIATFILIVGVAPASADELITIEVDEVLFAEPGSVTVITEVDVSSPFVGQECQIIALSENQVSIHPGNDLLISTGGGQTVIADVEAEPDAQITRSATVLLGPRIAIALRMGPDGVSSLGFDMSLDCGAAETIIETETPDCGPDDTGSLSDQGATDCSSQEAGDGNSTPTTMPILEAEVSPPVIGLPDPCHASGSGNLSLDDANCPNPEPAVPTTVPDVDPPDTEPPTGSTTEPTRTTPTTSAPSSTSATSGPTVLGLLVERGLPMAQPALPVQAQPDYTG